MIEWQIALTLGEVDAPSRIREKTLFRVWWKVNRCYLTKYYCRFQVGARAEAPTREIRVRERVDS